MFSVIWCVVVGKDQKIKNVLGEELVQRVCMYAWQWVSLGAPFIRPCATSKQKSLVNYYVRMALKNSGVYIWLLIECVSKETCEVWLRLFYKKISWQKDGKHIFVATMNVVFFFMCGLAIVIIMKWNFVRCLNVDIAASVSSLLWSVSFTGCVFPCPTVCCCAWLCPTVWESVVIVNRK